MRSFYGPRGVTERIVGKVLAAVVIAVATPVVMLVNWWDRKGYE